MEAFYWVLGVGEVFRYRISLLSPRKGFWRRGSAGTFPGMECLRSRKWKMNFIVLSRGFGLTKLSSEKFVKVVKLIH